MIYGGRERPRSITPMKEDRRLAAEQLSHPTGPSLPVSVPIGDEAGETALIGIYDTYLPLLRKIALRKFHIPRADVDALIHDVFATYLAHPERVRELHPYLIGGICNAAREYWRKHDRDNELFCDAPAGGVPVEDHLLESVAQNLLVRAALARLGTSCRETLHRFYIEGESAAAIAATRDTTQNSILRLLHYCRASARAAYLALGGAK